MQITSLQVQTTWTKNDEGPFGTHPYAFGLFDIVHFKERNTFVARAIVKPVKGGSYEKEATTIEEGRNDAGVVGALKDLRGKVCVDEVVQRLTENRIDEEREG